MNVSRKPGLLETLAGAASAAMTGQPAADVDPLTGPPEVNLSSGAAVAGRAGTDSQLDAVSRLVESILRGTAHLGGG